MEKFSDQSSPNSPSEAQHQILRSLAMQINKDKDEESDRLDEDMALHFVQALLEEE